MSGKKSINWSKIGISTWNSVGAKTVKSVFTIASKKLTKELADKAEITAESSTSERSVSSDTSFGVASGTISCICDAFSSSSFALPTSSIRRRKKASCGTCALESASIATCSFINSLATLTGLYYLRIDWNVASCRYFVNSRSPAAFFAIEGSSLIAAFKPSYT